MLVALIVAGCTPPVPPQPDASTVTGMTCNPGETYCPQSGSVRYSGCYDLVNGDFSCGACGRTCATGQTCINSRCGPLLPSQTCGSGNICPTNDQSFTCPNVDTDVANCGACNHTCDVGDACRVGHCHAPTDPYWQVAVQPEGAWIDACAAPGAQHVLPFATDGMVPVPLPFAFRFWGVTLPVGTAVQVAPDGVITLDGGPGGSGDVMVFQGVGTRGDGVCVTTVGTAPSRQFVVEWSDATAFVTDSAIYHLTFEVVLTETTSTFDFVYHTLIEEGSVAYTPGVGVLTADHSDRLDVCPGEVPDQACPQAGTRIHLTPVN